MSDNVSKKKFVDIVKQYIKYIEEKINNEINQLEGSDNKKNYELEALNKVSKSLLNYKEEIKKEANNLADKLCGTKRNDVTGNVEEDAKKINDIRKSLNKTLEELLNSYKKWFSNSLSKINDIFTEKNEKRLSDLNISNIKLEITSKEDEERKTLKKYKEIKNNSLKIFFKYLTDPSNEKVIDGIIEKIGEEYTKQKVSQISFSERKEFKIEKFSCENEIESLKNKLKELKEIYSKYKDGEINVEDSDLRLFDKKGNLSLANLYAYLLYEQAYEDFKKEVGEEEKKLKDLQDELKKIKENIYSKKSELNKAREEYNKRPTPDNKYEVGKLKKELENFEATKQSKENDIEKQIETLKNKQNNFIENSYLKYYDMENEMIKIPFNFPFDTITLNKKDSGEIESIKFNHKTRELTLSKEEEFKNLGQIESKEDELYGLVEIFEAFCYLYRIISKKTVIINNHINLYNNALLSKTDENSLYSILEKIKYVYGTEINDYLSKKDQDLYIENEWDFIFNKTEDKENGRNYWGTEFSNLEDIEISKKRNEFKEFIKEAVKEIKNKNPLETKTKLKKYEQKILDNNEFYKNNFRKIDGYYCFYLKDILSSFKIGENFVTTKDIVLGPLLDKTGMKEKKDILYYKKINKSLEGGDINLVIKKYWLKDINLNISKRDIDLYDYSKEIENSFKSLINNKLKK